MKSLMFLMSIIVGVSCYASAGEYPDMSIFHITGKWKSDSGKDFQLKQFGNKLTLIAMVYTSCQHTCPLITAKVRSIQKKLPKDLQKKINMSLISFDPERDTPKHLSDYKKKRRMGKEWTLVTGSSSVIRQLAAVLGVNYKKEKNGDFSHSNIITLIDKNGVVVEQVTDLGQDVAKITKKIIQLSK